MSKKWTGNEYIFMSIIILKKMNKKNINYNNIYRL